MSAPHRIAALTRYDALGASSRVRMLQYREPFAAGGLALRPKPLLDDDYLRAKYAHGRAGWRPIARAYLTRARALPSVAREAQLLWLEKELWPWAPAWLERGGLRGRPLVLDLDDAIFHNYDLHRSAAVRRLWGRKIDRLMAASDLVTAGNPYLAERARAAGAHRVEVIPTVIDLQRYPAPKPRPRTASDTLKVAWIGSPGTVHYLRLLAAPLARLSARLALELRVVGARIEMPGVRVVELPWTEATEVAAIAEADVGVMPLADSPWERGKCGYKLIQYMACGLPVVGSPVGVNREIVSEGVNGWLASDDTAWEQALSDIAADPARAQAMGAAGRARAEATYSLQAVAPRLIQLFKELL